jgi:hypothetical protein
MLVWSVFKIRSYLMANSEDDNAINIKTLTVHSTSFILFLFSNLIAEFFTLLFQFTSMDSHKFERREIEYDISGILFVICNFFS